MARTVIDLDDELLASVAKELGTSTKKDTVHAALQEVLASRRRAVALTRLRDAAADGALASTAAPGRWILSWLRPRNCSA